MCGKNEIKNEKSKKQSLTTIKFGGSSSPMNDFCGVHVIGDISDLKLKGDAIFNRMINLARQYNNQGLQNTIKQEKMDFDAKANQMRSNIKEFLFIQIIYY